MERYYDTYLFIEIIESIKGVIFLREAELDGVKVRIYQGITGRKSMIDCTDEDIPFQTGKDYLNQLGLSDLIPALFPEEKPVSETVTEENEE